jgi:hypothetical protein
MLHTYRHLNSGSMWRLANYDAAGSAKRIGVPFAPSIALPNTAGAYASSAAAASASSSTETSQSLSGAATSTMSFFSASKNSSDSAIGIVSQSAAAGCAPCLCNQCVYALILLICILLVCHGFYTVASGEGAGLREGREGAHKKNR